MVCTRSGSAKTPASGSSTIAEDSQLSHRSQCDIDEFGSTLISASMFGNRVVAEIVGLIDGARGDDVPSGTPATDVIERGEFACQIERFVIGGGRGGDQSDVLGHGGDGRQQSDRFECRECVALNSRAHCQTVGEEDRIEFAAFGDTAEFLEVLHIQDMPFLGAGMTPGRLVVADAHQEGVDMKGFPCRRHRASSSFRMVSQRSDSGRQRERRRSTATRTALNNRPDDRDGDDAGVHVGDLEILLGGGDEIAETGPRTDHLGGDQDQDRGRGRHPDTGEDRRNRGGQDDLLEQPQR